ncbi:hypothetical protein [Porphyromonas gingivalis]
MFRATVKKISRHVLGECQTGKFWRVACAEKAMSQGREENPKSCLSKF